MCVAELYNIKDMQWLRCICMYIFFFFLISQKNILKSVEGRNP
jgi:hypothetical protein